MKALFVAVLFSNAIMALSFLLVCFQRHSRDDKLSRVLTYFTSASFLWSLGSGALVVAKRTITAHLFRCVDLCGTVSYMIACIMLLGCISEIQEKIAKKFEFFASCGYALWLVSFHPDVFTFKQADWGMTFAFNSKAYGIVYVVFFIMCAAIMLYYICMMLKGPKKSIKFFGRYFLAVLIIIVAGTVSDMFLPFLGGKSAPGSSIAQFWGLLIIWYAADHTSHSRLTVKNMSVNIYDSLATPVLMAKPNGDIMVCNDSAKDFFGFVNHNDGEAYGNVYDLFDPPENLDESLGAPFVTFDGECKVNGVYCNIRSNRVFDHFAEPIGYITVVTDLSAQREASIKLDEAREEAIAANRAKSVFLANMSHEIRTPVNAIMGFSEIALSEEPKPVIREYLNDIKSASNTLLASINDILNISKIESGKMEIIEEDYSLKSLLKNVSKIISVQAGTKKLGFKLNITGYIPHKLHGDAVRIQEILINLCNNAVKYSEKGEIQLNVEGVRKSDDLVEVAFHVKDTGIGIKEEDIQNLFVAYARMDKEKNHRTEGTGLGLPIVHGYVNLMNGTIDVKSVYGEGSEFTVVLTQKIVDAKEADISTISDVSDKVTEIGRFRILNTKMLVVDDNKVNLKVMSRTLEKYGLNVDTAESGFKALDMCKSSEYDIVFMDHMMPEMDGVEAMKELRKLSDYYKNTSKIIVLTANAIDGVKNELMGEGFDDYLSKPLDYTIFEKVMRKFVSKENIEEMV